MQAKQPFRVIERYEPVEEWNRISVIPQTGQETSIFLSEESFDMSYLFCSSMKQVIINHFPPQRE